MIDLLLPFQGAVAEDIPKNRDEGASSSDSVSLTADSSSPSASAMEESALLELLACFA